MAEGSGYRPLSGLRGFLSTFDQLSVRANYKNVARPAVKARSSTTEIVAGGMSQKWEKGRLTAPGQTPEVLQECPAIGVEGKRKRWIKSLWSLRIQLKLVVSSREALVQ